MIIFNGLSVLSVMIYCSENGEWSSSTLLSLPPFSLSRWSQWQLWNYILAVIQQYWTEEVKGILALDPKRCRIIDPPVGFIVSVFEASKKKVCFGMVQEKVRLSQLGKVRGANCLVLKVWELNYDKDHYEITSWALVVHEVSFRSRVKTDRIFVIAFHLNMYNGDVVFMSRSNNIFKYQSGENKYERLGRFPDKISGITNF